jgi:hypothetical protein
VKEKHGSGPEHYSHTDSSGAVLEIYPKGSGLTTRIRLGFEVDDLDMVTFTHPTAKRINRDGKELLIVSDPEGSKIELTERRNDTR